MALLEAVESGHAHVVDLRGELGRVREALDRTDAVLGVADDAFVRAESGIVATRRIAPIAAVALGVAALAVIGVSVWAMRRRAHRQEASL